MKGVLQQEIAARMAHQARRASHTHHDELAPAPLQHVREELPAQLHSPKDIHFKRGSHELVRGLKNGILLCARDQEDSRILCATLPTTWQ